MAVAVVQSSVVASASAAAVASASAAAVASTPFTLPPAVAVALKDYVVNPKAQSYVNLCSLFQRYGIQTISTETIASACGIDAINLTSLESGCSCTNFFTGVINFEEAGKRREQAVLVDDRTGISVATMEKANAAILILRGANAMGTRAAAIGIIAAPHGSAALSHCEVVANATGQAASALRAAVYAGKTVVEARKAHESGKLQAKLAPLSPEERLAYLKRGLCPADDPILVTRERRKLARQQRVKEDQIQEFDALLELERTAERAALDDQTAILKANIEAMRRHGITVNPDISANLEQVVRARFGTKEALQALGRTVLAIRFKDKNVAKLTRCMGKEAVAKIQKAEMTKIRLGDLELDGKVQELHNDAKNEYRKRAVIYAIAAGTWVAICALSGGAVPLVMLGLLILAGLICGYEVRMAYENYKELCKEDTAPGTKDARWSMANIAFAFISLVGVIVLGMVLGWALPLIIVSGLLTSIWMIQSSLQLRAIGKRQSNYIEKLLKQKEIKLQEFLYILAHGNEDQFKRARAVLASKNIRITEESTRGQCTDVIQQQLLNEQRRMLEALAIELRTLNVEKGPADIARPRGLGDSIFDPACCGVAVYPESPLGGIGVMRHRRSSDFSSSVTYGGDVTS